jgi:hypothetical protein
MTVNQASAGLRLNVGCGRSILPGWVNVDSFPLPGIDVIADLDECGDTPLPIADNSAEEFLLSHVIEHLGDPLGLMEELHRIAQVGAIATIRCPYGSSDDADEDPTHVRRMFLQSFGYFSQPYYWRADYGYRGDWQPVQISLMVDGGRYRNVPVPELFTRVSELRNVVQEMVVQMKAIKPIREPKRELQVQPSVDFVFV